MDLADSSRGHPILFRKPDLLHPALQCCPNLADVDGAKTGAPMPLAARDSAMIIAIKCIRLDAAPPEIRQAVVEFVTIGMAYLFSRRTRRHKCFKDQGSHASGISPPIAVKPHG